MANSSWLCDATGRGTGSPMTGVKGLIVDGVKAWDKGIHRRLLAEATAPTYFT